MSEVDDILNAALDEAQTYGRCYVQTVFLNDKWWVGLSYYYNIGSPTQKYHLLYGPASNMYLLEPIRKKLTTAIHKATENIWWKI